MSKRTSSRSAEGIPVIVPFAFANVLAQEYGASSLGHPAYERYRYHTDLQEQAPSHA